MIEISCQVRNYRIFKCLKCWCYWYVKQLQWITESLVNIHEQFIDSVARCLLMHTMCQRFDINTYVYFQHILYIVRKQIHLVHAWAYLGFFSSSSSRSDMDMDMVIAWKPLSSLLMFKLHCLLLSKYTVGMCRWLCRKLLTSLD